MLDFRDFDPFPDPCPEGYTACLHCEGSGACPSCGSMGGACDDCDGTGACQTCHGVGIVFDAQEDRS